MKIIAISILILFSNTIAFSQNVQIPNIYVDSVLQIESVSEYRHSPSDKYISNLSFRIDTTFFQLGTVPSGTISAIYINSKANNNCYEIKAGSKLIRPAFYSCAEIHSIYFGSMVLSPPLEIRICGFRDRIIEIPVSPASHPYVVTSPNPFNFSGAYIYPNTSNY